MQYLTLSADFAHPVIRSGDTEFDPWEHIGDELTSTLSKWNAGYQTIIQMTGAEREAAAETIHALDETGLALAAAVEAELAPAKVRYYSEGLLLHLHSTGEGH